MLCGHPSPTSLVWRTTALSHTAEQQRLHPLPAPPLFGEYQRNSESSTSTPACTIPPLRRISFLGSGLLLTNYGAAIGAALRLPGLFNPWTMGLGHACLAAMLLYKTIKLDAGKYSQQAIKEYYAAIW